MFETKIRSRSCGDLTPRVGGGQSRARFTDQRGQIVVEYLLLVIIAVMVATLITKTMISPDPSDPGFVFSAWSSITKDIGADYADDVPTR